MATCFRAHELDVVRLTTAAGGWPRGTEGTVVSEHRDYLLIEVGDPSGEAQVIDVAPNRAKVIWRAKGAQII